MEALHAQRGITSDVEIIVVDNGSARLPDTICSAWPDVQLVSERIPGPGPARNRGIREARGQILAFIDADCRADPGWLSAIETALTDGKTTIIGGDVRVGYEHPSRPTFLEPYESIYSYRNSEHIAEGFSGTGNLATLPSVVARVGPFAGIEVAEDRDWGLRACAAGYAIRYVPEMIVFHPARKTFAELKGNGTGISLMTTNASGLNALGPPLARQGHRSRRISVVELRTVLFSPRVSGPRERIWHFSV